MSEGKNNSPEESARREIIGVRVFDAPRELVWEAWTNPKHLIQWWGPKGFTNTFHEIEVKPGGVWRFVMHGPDGRDYPNENVFEELVRPERISLRHVSEPQFRMRVTFEDEGAKTKITMRLIFGTAEERDRTAIEFGALEGLGQTMDRLGELVAKLKA